MKLATWNVNSLTVRIGQVEDWIKKSQPDLLLLQETKQENIKFPHEAISALGYTLSIMDKKPTMGLRL